MIRDSEEIVRALLLLAEKGLPPEYGWRMAPVQAFTRQSEEIHRRSQDAAQRAEALNRHYWHDAARNVEAYSVLSVWRGGELVQATLDALNRKKVLPPAIVARALLELAVSFIYLANIVEDIVDEGLKAPAGIDGPQRGA